MRNKWYKNGSKWYREKYAAKQKQNFKSRNKVSFSSHKKPLLPALGMLRSYTRKMKYRNTFSYLHEYVVT